MTKMKFTSGFKKFSNESQVNSGSNSNKKRVMGLILGLVIGVSAAMSVFAQSRSILADNFPERYVVVKGDTLWDISGRFLRDPWRWPEVWQGNPQVNNPDLIFPGDVLVMTFINGRPVLRKLQNESRNGRLSPRVRSSVILDAIPVIDPSSIEAYLRAPLVTDENELSTAPYIVDGFDNRLLLGQYSQFYARGFNHEVANDSESDGNGEVTSEDHGFAKEYNIFRPGRRFVDPVTGESLGWEAVDLGLANFLKEGDPARLIVTKSHEDVTIKDRLRPVLTKEALPFFHPHAPSDIDIRGVILQTPNRATELGALSIIAINLGERESIDNGTVFRIKSKSKSKKDPITGGKYSIPEEPVGLAMVFRTFEKVSYAIVTNTERQVEPGDVLVSPYAD